jgi:F0F1-type ATP synthase assembly protein I
MDIENKKKGVPEWVPAMKIFSEISTWIAVPIILAVIVGKILDNKYGTKPTLLLVSAGLAFVVSIFGIVKSVRIYGNNVKRQAEKKEGESNSINK